VKKYLVLPMLVVLLGGISHAADMVIGNFSAGNLDGWEPQTFRGKSESKYSLSKDGERIVLRAYSRNSASGLIRKVKVIPEQYSVLRWSWKIDRPLKKEDGTRKEGDDYAARVYVVFPGTFFWRTRAIVYVWSDKLAEGTAIRNPYTSNAVIVAAEAGRENAGKWVHEERNYYEDYRRLFGEYPPKLGAVAVMTDTDDTSDEATAWYGDIILSRAHPQMPPESHRK
jgi:hypothetical protein